MNFPVSDKNFNGLFRRFSDTGGPRIELLPSSIDAICFPKYIFWYNNSEKHFCSRIDDNNPYLIVKVCDFPFLITHYEISSHPSDQHYMRAWKFEGSLDNVHYDVLDDRPVSSDLSTNAIKKYKVNNRRKLYQYFRVNQTVKTLSNLITMRISGLDIYGTFIPIRCSSSRKSVSSLFNLIHFLMLKN